MAKYKKNASGYYRETFTIPGKTAKGHYNRVTIRDKDEKMFKKKLTEARKLYGRGVALENTLVSEWAERWLSVYKANVSKTQKAHYRAKLKNDILPVIGSMRMRDVRPSHLQELLNSHSGGKASTVAKIKQAIQQIFSDAEVEGIIDRNPSTRIELPKVTEEPRRPITPLERAVLFEVAKTHERGAYVLTMLFCGLRRGECLALLVGDVDFARSRISIKKSWSFITNQGYVKSPKSMAGFREVPIPDLLLPYLTKQCAGRQANDILFPRENGEHATKMASNRWWHSFVRECHLLAGAGVYRSRVLTETSLFSDDISPHYLRHTYATDLYAAGVDEKAQKTFLGHSSTDVTDQYRKMNETAFSRALGLINAYNATLCIWVSPERRTSKSFQYCAACALNTISGTQPCD
jgi:integrase